MRPPHRAPMPELGRMLRETNELLTTAGLSVCESVHPVADPDTASPTVIGHQGGRPRYVIKAIFRHPEALRRQLEVANSVRTETGLPIPRHLCCAKGEESLPLMVMEWMPGEQLRTMLPSLSRADGRTLTRDWGRCLARFHTATHPPALPRVPGGPGSSQEWLRAIAARGAAALSKDARHTELVNAGLQFLDERLPALDSPLLSALTKADQDVRDFLGLLDPEPHISAMLDWERVAVGDAYYEIAVIYLRHRFLGIEELWDAFRTGYEEWSGQILTPNRHYECYLMSRALLGAPNFPTLAADIISRLLHGVDAGLGHPL